MYGGVEVPLTNGTFTITGVVDQTLIVYRNEIGRVFDLTIEAPLLSGVYTQLSSGPTARNGHSAVTIDGQMYIFGGNDSGGLNDLWRYDPSTDIWSQLTSGATGRYGHSAVAIQDLMYLFGGYGGSYLNDLWLVE
jgi:hypothetical protein